MLASGANRALTTPPAEVIVTLSYPSALAIGREASHAGVIVGGVADTLHTERLALEPWSLEHTGLLSALAMTPAVVRYVGDGATWSEARVHAVSERNLEHWREHGFGWRVARLAGTGESAGLIALNFAVAGSGLAAGEYEIGWWLSPRLWGRGLAREGAAALRDEAFGRVGAPSIVARVQPANRASLAVAAAIGMQVEGEGVGRMGERFTLLRLASGPAAAGSR